MTSASPLTIHHMSGAGNAFVVVDARDVALQPSDLQSLVPSLCDRSHVHLQTAEGVLALNAIGEGSATSTFYNPDGSSGAMCGNGGRCLVRFALDKGAVLDKEHRLVFSMAGTVYTATISDDENVCVDFPPPTEVRDFLPNEIPELPNGGTYVNVGSDHVVLDMSLLANNVAPFDEFPLTDLALPIRHSSAFTHGSNVNIATVVDRGTVHMRTYERGVEAETGACGTGAISTAVALWRSGVIDSSVTLVPTSKKPLRVNIHHHDDVIDGVTLCGDAIYDAEPSLFDTSSGTYL